MESAEVKKKARMFTDLAKKQYRVGKGQPDIWKEQKQTNLKICLKIIKTAIKPVNPITIFRAVIKKRFKLPFIFFFKGLFGSNYFKVNKCIRKFYRYVQYSNEEFMKLYDIILSSVEKGIELQNEDGSMPSGHNGPYFDNETPVRNTSHWVIIFIKAYHISGNFKFREAIVKASNYLLSKTARPMNKAFWLRKNPDKDFSNGLVGQAWVIEALTSLYNFTEDSKFIDLAIELFNLHTYVEKMGGWKVLNVDGSYAGFDKTFNHQLWFAASGSLILKYKSDNNVKHSLVNFLSMLDDHMQIYHDGVIRHWSPNFMETRTIDIIYNYLRFFLRANKKKEYDRMKAVGYHSFNLYAFAILKQNKPDHKFWKNRMFKKAKKVSISEKFLNEVERSKYSYPYNPPGFELAYFIQEFYESYLDNQIEELLKLQFKRCYDFKENLMIQGETKDKMTSAARLYEATRLKNYKIKEI